MIVAIAWACSAVAVAGLLLEVVNLAEFSNLRGGARCEGNVVACVAMRNEAPNVRGCIASLLGQEQVSAIVLCDDGSTDETFKLMCAAAEREPKIQVVRAASDGAGSLRAFGSKSRALAGCAKVAAKMPHTHLFFSDADVRLHNGAIASLLALGVERNVEAVSAWPKVIAASPWDAILAPVLVLFLLQALPLRAVRGRDRRFAAANGQLFLIDRAAYERCGGHGACPAEVEDVALARALRKAGARIALGNAAQVASVRGYGSLSSNIRGYGRSLYFGAGPTGTLAFSFWQTCAFVVPWVILPFARRPAIAGAVASLTARLLLEARMPISLAGALAVPLSGLCAAYAALASYLVGKRGEFSWRGRPL